MIAPDANGWMPISTAPKVIDQRILAWCAAAESMHGIVELIWSGTGWRMVVEHPWPNACLCPIYWQQAPKPPVQP